MKKMKMVLTVMLAFVLGAGDVALAAGGLPMGAAMERGAMMQDAAILNGGRVIPLTDADADFAPILVAQKKYPKYIKDARQKRTEYKGWTLGGHDENGKYYGGSGWSTLRTGEYYEGDADYKPGWHLIHYAIWEGNWQGAIGVAGRHSHKGHHNHIDSPTEVEKQTPLHIAVKYDKLDALKAILAHQFNYYILERGGINLNAQNKWGNTPLHVAAVLEREEMVKSLVEAGADLNVRNNEGQTPLEFAEAKGKNRMVYLLDTLGAEVDDGEGEVVYDLKEIVWRVTKYNDRNRSDYGYSDNPQLKRYGRGDGEIFANYYYKGEPLYQEGWLDIHHMARDDNFNMLLAIASGQPVLNKKTDKEKQTPLHIAAWHGNTKTVLYMLREKDHYQIKYHGDLEIDPKERYGKTPLHFAAARGHEQIVKLLVAAGASIDEPDRDGKTPLHQAAQAGESGVVKVLLELGANRDLKDNKGNTPARLAEKHGKKATARRLRERETNELAKGSDGFTELHEAAKKGDHKEVRSLVQKWGKDINDKTAKNQDTALHIAAWYGKDKVVEYITKARKRIRADINLGDINGSTPLHNAAAAGHTKIAKMLIQAGAKIDAQDKNGNTPLHRAAEKNKSKMAEFLVKNGAEIDKKNSSHKTPSWIAAENGNTNAVRKLADLGASQDFMSDAILLAADQNNLKAVKALLALGADKNTTGHQGITPLHYAAEDNSHEIVQYLVDQGADIYRRTTGYHYAIDYSNHNHGTESESSHILRRAAYDAFMEYCQKDGTPNGICNLRYWLTDSDGYPR